MFSFFKRKKEPITVTDLIWTSNEIKADGLTNSFRILLNANSKIGLFYYFNSTKSWVEAILDQMNLAINERANIELFSAEELLRSTQSNAALKLLLNATAYQLIFVEHHPLRSKDSRVYDRLFELSGKHEQIDCYVSLKEPLMAVFGSNRIIEIMQRMGYKEDELISHKMISRSIIRAQEKIEQKVSHELRAESPDEWFNINFVNQ